VVALLACIAPPTALAAEAGLTVVKTGSGTGTVTSSPPGIDCGASCVADFAQGEVITLTATSGPHTQQVTWTGCDSEPSPTECTVTMSTAKEVVATFDLDLYTVSVSRVGTGQGVVEIPGPMGCGIDCFPYGTVLLLRAVPDRGSEFVEWIGCESPRGNECEVTVREDMSISAVFEQIPEPQLTVTPSGTGGGTVTSSPSGIDCGATCKADFAPGREITLTAKPAPDSEFAGWEGCGQVNGEECKVVLNANSSVTAIFNLSKQRLTVEKAGSGTGAVISSPAGVDCGATCAVDFTRDTAITLTATPGPHSQQVVWAGCESEPSPTECTVTMSSAKTVTATFDLDRYTVSAFEEGSGEGVILGPDDMYCAAACSTVADYGTVVTLTAIPRDTGSAFARWIGCEDPHGAECHVTVREDTSVTAVFSRAFQPFANAQTGSDTTVAPVFSPSPPPAPAPPPSNRFTVSHPRLMRNGLATALKIAVPGPGSLTAIGAYLGGISSDLHQGGHVKLRLTLTARGRRALHSARGHRLRTRVAITYRPSGGRPATLVLTVMFD
jgi:hypothetical protein